MKRSALLTLLFFGFFVVSSVFLAPSNAQRNVAPSRTGPKDPEIADTVRRLTDRSMKGLVQQRNSKGGDMLNLQGRFQEVALSKLDAEGDPMVGCVGSVEEANDFFGRDLETGELLTNSREAEYLATKRAARTDMSREEFEFYKGLIETQSLQLGSPNAATFIVQNQDGPNEGFNDPTPVSPEGGNPGTTRGQLRLNLFNYAAGIWSSFLDSNVPIKINAQFDPLTCSTGSAILGSAAATSVQRNFSGAEFSNTWYPVALANKRAGTDLSPPGELNLSDHDINATFNSSIDNGCFSAGHRFYYGYDNSTPSLRTNLLVVVLHEFAHGLGFQVYTNGSTGQESGSPPATDIYARHVYDRSVSLFWNQMTDAQRVTSARNSGNLFWDGPNLNAASGFMEFGREASSGRVQLYAPSTFSPGPSVSHFDTVSFPNLLMEPNISVGLPLDLDLTKQQMRDIGWYRDSNGDRIPDTITNVLPNGGTLFAGGQATVNWTNNGGFNRNVTIELSTNGGSTFPTVIASDVPNFGSFTFTVPNSPSEQARVRVREHGFVSPVGTSSANFTISGTTASPTPTVAPSPTPTVAPSPTPTVAPSPTPTVAPSPTPTVAPSPTPTVAPSPTPTVAPSPTPTVAPSPTPTVAPSPTPTVAPSPTPTPFNFGFEGDVASRFTGDGLLLFNDISLVRQFIVGSLIPDSSFNEFQRADIAPLGTLGDGLLTAGDTIQARRYVAGLDPKIAGGGSAGLSESTLGAIGGTYWEAELDGNSRWLRVTNGFGSPGGQVTVGVELMPMGNEMASSFTLYFDQSLLSNPVATVGSGLPTDTVLTVNTSQQANGRVMLLLDSADILGSATELKRVVNITFNIAPNAAFGDTEVSFGNWPTVSSISDQFGNLVATGFNSGLVTIGQPSTDVNGRVVTPTGQGLRNAQVTITKADGTTRTTPTSSLGFFSFAGIELGQTITVRVNSRRYRFDPQTVGVSSNMAALQFVGLE